MSSLHTSDELFVRFFHPQGVTKMTRGSSINFKKGSAGFEHNDRTEEREPKHLLPVEYRQENECDRSAPDASELLKEMVENAKEKYTERTGQKCQAKILSVEAVINLEAHHTLKDVEKINEYLEQKHGLRAVQSSIHRDEGHINDEGKPEYNLHAHVVYCNLDKDGKTILKGLEKDDFRELQTFVAKTLQMQRGQSAEITKAKHKTPQEFRHEKVLATQKDLKTEMAQLKSEFKERGATRSEYAQIEQLNKELKEQITAKELSNDQLTKSLETVRSLRSSDQTKILELSQTVEDLKKDILEISTKPQISPAIVQEYSELKEKYSKSEKTIEALNSELQEAKRPSAAVEVAQGDTAQLKELENLSETWATHISNPDFSKKEEIEELEKAIPTHDPKKVAIAVYNSHIVADTGIMGKLGGEKKDTDLLIANMAKEIEKRDKLLKRAIDMLKNSEITRKRVTDSIKTIVKSTERALKSFFSQKERDLSSTPKKELTEQLQRTIRSRGEILQDAKEISQGFFDKLNAQSKDKEPEQTKSRGMDLS